MSRCIFGAHDFRDGFTCSICGISRRDYESRRELNKPTLIYYQERPLEQPPGTPAQATIGVFADPNKANKMRPLGRAREWLLQEWDDFVIGYAESDCEALKPIEIIGAFAVAIVQQFGGKVTGVPHFAKEEAPKTPDTQTEFIYRITYFNAAGESEETRYKSLSPRHARIEFARNNPNCEVRTVQQVDNE